MGVIELFTALCAARLSKDYTNVSTFTVYTCYSLLSTSYMPISLFEKKKRERKKSCLLEMNMFGSYFLQLNEVSLTLQGKRLSFKGSDKIQAFKSKLKNLESMYLLP